MVSSTGQRNTFALICRTGGKLNGSNGTSWLPLEGKAEVWRRWRLGESFSGIGQAVGKPPGSIFGLIRLYGGYSPPVRKRSERALSLAAREEISRGIAAGLSIRNIFGLLRRAPSTVSREIKRHGGLERYRAVDADEGARKSAGRPKPCALQKNRRLRYAVERKLRFQWAPEQISDWLKLQYPDD